MMYHEHEMANLPTSQKQNEHSMETVTVKRGAKCIYIF